MFFDNASSEFNARENVMSTRSGVAHRMRSAAKLQTGHFQSQDSSPKISNHLTGKSSHQWTKWFWSVWRSVFEKSEQMEQESAKFYYSSIYEVYRLY